MDDRELLQLAAKAAGLTIIGGFGFGDRPGCDVLDESRSSGTRWWSPLTDDGDALRLAVLAKLTPCQGYKEALVNYYADEYADRQTFLRESYSDHNDDPFAATRRAIVRAAAEIGKASNGN